MLSKMESTALSSIRISRIRTHARQAHTHVPAHAHSTPHADTRSASGEGANPPSSAHSPSPSRDARSIGAAASSARVASPSLRSAVSPARTLIAAIGSASASLINPSTHGSNSVHRRLARIAARSPVDLNRVSILRTSPLLPTGGSRRSIPSASLAEVSLRRLVSTVSTADAASEASVNACTQNTNFSVQSAILYESYNANVPWRRRA